MPTKLSLVSEKSLCVRGTITSTRVSPHSICIPARLDHLRALVANTIMQESAKDNGLFGAVREVEGRDLESVEPAQESPHMISAGVADNDAVQSCNALAPEKADHLWPACETLRRRAGSSRRRTGRAPVVLPRVYKSHDQRALGLWLDGVRL
jgi:hypothetical protein